MRLRKTTKNRGSHPSDDALLRLFYLEVAKIAKKRLMQLRAYKAALTRFTIQSHEGMPKLKNHSVYPKSEASPCP